MSLSSSHESATRHPSDYKYLEIHHVVVDPKVESLEAFAARRLLEDKQEASDKKRYAQVFNSLRSAKVVYEHMIANLDKCKIAHMDDHSRSVCEEKRRLRLSDVSIAYGLLIKYKRESERKSKRDKEEMCYWLLRLLEEEDALTEDEQWIIPILVDRISKFSEDI